MREKITGEERAEALASLPEWQLLEDRDAIRRVFKFADFSAAWAFMSRAALLAEAMDHHPEWSNVYSAVDVTLTTHDADGLSALDIKMAQTMDAWAG